MRVNLTRWTLIPTITFQFLSSDGYGIAITAAWLCFAHNWHWVTTRFVRYTALD